MNTTRRSACTLLFALSACQAPVDAPAPDPVDQNETPPTAYTHYDVFSSASLNGGDAYNELAYSVDLGISATGVLDPNTFDRESIRGGVSANGPSTDGIDTEELSGLTLEQTLLANVGEAFTARLVDGRTYQMVVVRVVTDATTSRRYYEVETSLDGGPWIPLCGDDEAGAPLLALAVPGVFTPVAVGAKDRAGGWRASTHEFNFACQGSSVAKCVEMGFAPHLELANRPTTVPSSDGAPDDAATPGAGQGARGEGSGKGSSGAAASAGQGAGKGRSASKEDVGNGNAAGMKSNGGNSGAGGSANDGGRPSVITTPVSQAYHEACVRMLRADYCGDGVPHTEAGVRIRYWDRRGEAPSLDGWTFEAGWSEDGATCIETTRLDQTDAPGCVQERVASACEANALSHAIIRNAF